MCQQFAFVKGTRRILRIRLYSEKRSFSRTSEVLFALYRRNCVPSCRGSPFPRTSFHTRFAQLVSGAPPQLHAFEKHYNADASLYSFSIDGKDVINHISFPRYPQNYITKNILLDIYFEGVISAPWLIPWKSRKCKVLNIGQIRLWEFQTLNSWARIANRIR